MEHVSVYYTVTTVCNAELLQLAESNLRCVIPNQRRQKSILAPFANHPQGRRMDTVVLACTHFPLLRAELAQHLGPHVALVDSGEAIARRVEHWLQALALEPGTQKPRNVAMFTLRSGDIDTLAPALTDLGFNEVATIPV